jgi:hypothetical protein
MVHSTQDYSGRYRQETVYGNIDNGELATRTFPLTSVDRRGNVVWFDDFEGAAAAKWATAATAPGTVALSTDYAWHGNQSMKCTGGANVNDSCSLLKYFSLPYNNRMGIEIMFHIKTNKPRVEFRFGGYSGVNVYNAGFGYDHNLGMLYYRNAADAAIALTLNDYVGLGQGFWIPMKLVVDWDKNEYVRILFGGTEYDMTGIPIYAVANAALQYLFVIVYAINASAASAVTYFDNFILTQNE